MTHSAFRRPSYLCAGLLCVTVWAATAARAQLAIELDTARTEYVVDEPLCVIVTLANIGACSAPFTRMLEPAMGMLSFEIGTPDGRSYILQRGGGSLLAGAIENSIAWLAPGEEYSTSADLSRDVRTVPGEDAGWYQADGEIKPIPGPPELLPVMLLAMPGEYAIRACYSIPQNWPLDQIEIWSNFLRVCVAAPTGDDLAAHEILRAGPRTEDSGIWNAAQEQAETYEHMIRDYPTSVYAIYARQCLGSIHGLAGMHYLRGKPEARGLLEESADLFLKVAQDAGQTLSGLRATEATAKTLATLGRAAEAQALLEEAFLWPIATDTDRGRLVSTMKHIETGYFWTSGGLPGNPPSAELSVPLRDFAEVLGFSVGWASETNSVTISNRRVGAILEPGEGEGVLTINGVQRAGVRTALKGGEVYVPPSVVFDLVRADWGQPMEDKTAPQVESQGPV